MALVYAAITQACIFRLDDLGICREISPGPGASAAALEVARRCIGAQYLAALDPSVEGLLAQLPRPGTRLLFARTEADGRIVLMRSGPLERFDDLAAMEEDGADADDVTLRPQLATLTPPNFGNEAEELSIPHPEAPPTQTFQNEETAPFSRSKHPPVAYDSVEELAAVTRRSPSTVREVPAPPAALAATPAGRARLRNPDRIV